MFKGIVQRIGEIWNDDEDLYPVFPWLKEGTPSKIGVETSGRQELWGSLEEVLEVVNMLGLASEVRNWLFSTPKKPRVGKALSLKLQADGLLEEFVVGNEP